MKRQDGTRNGTLSIELDTGICQSYTMQGSMRSEASGEMTVITDATLTGTINTLLTR